MRIIAGRWRGRRIVAPAGRDVRPTTDRVREAWMSMLAPELDGARVVDLFAGSGALGLEALSRGAASVVFVEQGRDALEALRRNVATLGAEPHVQIVRADAARWAEALAPLAFDLALADPPYGAGYAARLLQHWTGTPFARTLWVEHRADEPLPPIPGLWSRRYGDTTLTSVEATP
jgi:16S rRNA (guanine966-N2)-methyltransferase